jgi:uncharacterized protein with FMN-binding domain
MARIALWLASTVAAVVLLFSYSTSTSTQMAASGHSEVISGSLSAESSTAGGSTVTRSTVAGSTVTGQVVPTAYGPVQVEITVAGGTITKVNVLRYPDSGGTDQQINGHALPILVQETLDAQGSTIDMVSGATYTSAGYEESLQSALDQAGL